MRLSKLISPWRGCVLLVAMSAFAFLARAQTTPILSYDTTALGQVEIEVGSAIDSYYLLQIKLHPDSGFDLYSSIQEGTGSTITFTEGLPALPLSSYRVLEYPNSSPEDVDSDGVDDLTEHLDYPNQSAINSAPSVDSVDGAIAIESALGFSDLAEKEDEIPWLEFLNGKEFVKYIILDFSTHAQVYFVNSRNHKLHADFVDAVGIDLHGVQVIKGQIAFHPEVLSAGGTIGTYAFNYSNNQTKDFYIVQRTLELLAANMPFLENNLSYFVTSNSENLYQIQETLYDGSRVHTVFESEVYAGLNYWGLNQKEGYGLFRKLSLEDSPGPKDIVLYESLPNNMPRVAGVMTSVVQTPLSHVNLRSIQNQTPNAFIRDPLSIPGVAELLDDYVYYKVMEDTFEIRKATIQEVNAWHDALRSTKERHPPLNLLHTEILPLDEIDFDMFDGYGAKCSNLASMRKFGFPEGTIPNGFGVPFYYYQQFMEYNNLYDEVRWVLEHPEFNTDRQTKELLLKNLRDKIKAADMPLWMLNNLDQMHRSFPEGTAVRCRSSSNNEDLPGFNGAGLYTSKTQHLDEGHISKSIKQVYASLWNLRAFEEREFYRINHFSSSMGVLCHPNFSDEIANGVGISADPIYEQTDKFYLNTQLGEDLVTNPDTNSRPEEILLDKEESSGIGYIVVERSNLVEGDTTLMSAEQLELMREYLQVIHSNFEPLYSAEENETFAMEIEYKVTSTNQIAIKQARPWVEYVPAQTESTYSETRLEVFPNPASEIVVLRCLDCAFEKVKVFNTQGELVLDSNESASNQRTVRIPIVQLASGLYIIAVYNDANDLISSTKILKE